MWSVEASEFFNSFIGFELNFMKKNKIEEFFKAVFKIQVNVCVRLLRKINYGMK